jgi:hypothetical protein
LHRTRRHGRALATVGDDFARTEVRAVAPMKRKPLVSFELDS